MGVEGISTGGGEYLRDGSFGQSGMHNTVQGWKLLSREAGERGKG